MKLVKKLKLKVNQDCKDYLVFASEQCRLLYNFTLADKLDYYKEHKKGISIYQQKLKLKDIKKQYPNYSKVYNKCLAEMFFRLDKAFKHFFIKQNKFPKFKRKGVFVSQVYPSMYIERINDNMFIIPTGGRNKNHIARTSEKIPEQFTTVIIKKQKNDYFACFLYDEKEIKFEDNNKYLGIDLGIKTLATGFNNDNEFVIINKFKYHTKHLDKFRSKRDKCKKYSIRWKKWNRIFYKHLKKYQNRCNDYFHKATYYLAKQRKENTIIVGKLNLNNMKTEKSWFNRILLNEWKIGRFVEFLNYKCERFGKKLIKINEAYTTKTCSRCGCIKEMKLSNRIYKCNDCGFKIDRDMNSSINILKRYLNSLAEAGESNFSEFVQTNNLNISTFNYI